VSPLDELQLWCKVAKINKDNIYELGFESVKEVGNHSYQKSSLSLVHAIREDIEQLKNKVKVVETEKDDID